MWKAIGCDCWIVVPIASVCRAGHTLEGTRLTITKSKEVPDGHEFSIRTPVTPPRWDDFDKELTQGFEAICSAALDNGPHLVLATHLCCWALVSRANGTLHCCCTVVGYVFEHHWT